MANMEKTAARRWLTMRKYEEICLLARHESYENSTIFLDSLFQILRILYIHSSSYFSKSVFYCWFRMTCPSECSLTNLLSKRMDDEIALYCNDNGFVYSRYADDITISSKEWEKYRQWMR